MSAHRSLLTGGGARNRIVPLSTLGAVAALFAVAALVAPLAAIGAATPSREPRHYVFVGRERDRIRDSSFLDTRRIAGAEIKYTWRELEPRAGVYVFAPVLEDLALLERHGKRLVLQLQDVSFDSTILVPPDLLTDPAYGGGIASQWSEGAKGELDRFDGFVARRWDPEVHARFTALLDTLGSVLDGRLEALVLPETSLDFGTEGKHAPADFTPDGYRATIHARMRAAQLAFPRSGVIQYANFMPGEWLPWEDHGHLRSVYALAESLGAGVGGPDLLPHRRGQRNHSLKLLRARSSRVRGGLAVQDGNLAERNPATGKRVTVVELATFARDSLRLDYVFWGTEEPYYSRDVLPWLAKGAR